MNDNLSDEAKSSITARLATLLADIHQLYIKSLGFHWNIVDPRFSSLHELFEVGYTQLAKDLDEVAERIRKLDHLAPSSVASLSSLSRLKDTQETQNGDQMLDLLANDYESLLIWLREDISNAEQHGDPGTADLLTGMLRVYEKQVWILKSHKSE